MVLVPYHVAGNPLQWQQFMDDQQFDPSWLYTPSLSTVQPPTQTKLSALPFDQLTWQDFERLCHRLVRTECNIEYSKHGVQGTWWMTFSADRGLTRFVDQKSPL